MIQPLIDVETLDPKARYALRDRVGDVFVVRGSPDANDGLPMLLRPARHDCRLALTLAPWAIEKALPILRKRYPNAEFVVVLGANSCPSCGKLSDTGEPDFIHPDNREKTQWIAACYEHNFGCGYAVYGTTFDDVTRKWNAGAPDETELEALSHVGPNRPRKFVVAVDEGG